MSQTYSLLCEQCRKALWVGQSTARNTHGWFLYTGAEHVEALQAFLAGHRGHHLVLHNDATLPEDAEDVDDVIQGRDVPLPQDEPAAPAQALTEFPPLFVSVRPSR